MPDDEPPLLRDGEEFDPEPRDGVLSTRGVDRGESFEGDSVRGRVDGSERVAGLRSLEGEFVRGVVFRSLRGLPGVEILRLRDGTVSRGLLNPGLVKVRSTLGFDGL